MQHEKHLLFAGMHSTNECKGPVRDEVDDAYDDAEEVDAGEGDNIAQDKEGGEDSNSNIVDDSNNDSYEEEPPSRVGASWKADGNLLPTI